MTTELRYSRLFCFCPPVAPPPSICPPAAASSSPERAKNRFLNATSSVPIARFLFCRVRSRFWGRDGNIGGHVVRAGQPGEYEQLSIKKSNLISERQSMSVHIPGWFCVGQDGCWPRCRYRNLHRSLSASASALLSPPRFSLSKPRRTEHPPSWSSS